MSYKTRGNYPVGACFKNCKHQGTEVCEDCIRFSEFEKETKEMMKIYIGTKIIKAEPMFLGEYNKVRGWEMPKDEDPMKEGYLVEYDNNYISWSPKEVFEGAYREVSETEKDVFK